MATEITKLSFFRLFHRKSQQPHLRWYVFVIWFCPFVGNHKELLADGENDKTRILSKKHEK